MSHSGTSVSSEQRGYGRGLILGLTMAESMLLLVFCLLLAAGAIIAREKKDVKAALAQKVVVQQELTKQKDIVASLKEDLKVAAELSSPDPELKKDWRELILNQRKVAALEKKGVSLDEVDKNAEVIKVLLEKKFSKSELIDAAAVSEALRFSGLPPENLTKSFEAAKQVADAKINPKTLSEIARLDLKPEELEAVVKVTEGMKTTVDELLRMSVAIDLLRKDVLVGTETPPEMQLQKVLDKAKAFDSSQEGSAPPHEWPPIINLSETKDYFFTSGSAELSPKFGQVLREGVAQQIAKTASGYNVDVIEVIGHTDEQRMGRRPSNLDVEFKDVLNGRTSASELQPADNAGLGLARAIAVAEILREDPNLKNMTILPMSGAQLILPGDRLTDGSQAGDVSSRRRIEIRVRKRNQETAPSDHRQFPAVVKAVVTGKAIVDDATFEGEESVPPLTTPGLY